VCPNCHRRAHYAHDRLNIKARVKRRVAVIERQWRRGKPIRR
jgi:predicted HNH restriction endonuclease